MKTILFFSMLLTSSVVLAEKQIDPYGTFRCESYGNKHLVILKGLNTIQLDLDDQDDVNCNYDEKRIFCSFGKNKLEIDIEKNIRWYRNEDSNRIERVQMNAKINDKDTMCFQNL
jgi:hypothetical protein